MESSRVMDRSYDAVFKLKVHPKRLSMEKISSSDVF